MYSKDKKTKKTIRLDHSVIEAVEAFRTVNNLDFTKATEALVMRGLENTRDIERVVGNIDKRLAKIEKKQQQDTDRLAYLLIGIGRMIGRVYGHTKSFLNNSYDISKEDLFSLENNGIKKVQSDLKWRHEVHEGEYHVEK
jgi:hypothetical protein